MWVDKQSWAQDILGADPQDLQKSLNRREDLHCAPLVDVVNALVLPLPPSTRQPAATHNAEPKPLFTVTNHSELYIWFLPPPPECWVLYVNPQINMHRFYLISQLVEWL